MPEIIVKGRRLGYEAQPLDFDRAQLVTVFVHGSGGDRNDWRGQLDGLSDRFSVLALELPGHGVSEPPGESTVPAYAQWVAASVETLGFPRVLLVGCSLGSAIVQWLALSPQPWLVGIGLVGAGAKLAVHPAFLEGILQDHKTAIDMLTGYAVAVDASVSVRDTIREKFRRNPPELLHGDLAACNSFDIRNEVSAIKVPTCIIVGEQDRLTPVKYSLFLRDQIAGSELFVIPGAGHLVMLEKPDVFNDHLATFIQKLATKEDEATPSPVSS